MNSLWASCDLGAVHSYHTLGCNRLVLHQSSFICQSYRLVLVQEGNWMQRVNWPLSDHCSDAMKHCSIVHWWKSQLITIPVSTVWLPCSAHVCGRCLEDMSYWHSIKTWAGFNFFQHSISVLFWVQTNYSWNEWKWTKAFIPLSSG